MDKTQPKGITKSIYFPSKSTVEQIVALLEAKPNGASFSSVLNQFLPELLMQLQKVGKDTRTIEIKTKVYV